MKKSGLNININLTNRAIYTVVAFAIFISISFTVFAFGTSSPNTFGHSAKEIDLSGGVDGDVVFSGNLDVGGDIKSSGNLDVIGSIKIGSAATCDVDSEGSIKYDSASKKIEFCDGTDWAAFGTGTGGAGYTGNLVNSVHTGDDCIAGGGITTQITGGEYLCKFSSNSCATGWTQYEQWSTTSAITCSAPKGICPGVPCTTTSHAFSDNVVETCPYERGNEDNWDGEFYCAPNTPLTCTATLLEIGCY